MRVKWIGEEKGRENKEWGEGIGEVVKEVTIA